MLRKRFRLKSRSLFKKTLGGRRLCSSDYFAVYGLTRSEVQPGVLPKFGFIVSKKIDKRATRRNRIKRRLREIIRTEILPSYKATLENYLAIVIIARTGSLEASYGEMQKRLRNCFQ